MKNAALEKAITKFMAARRRGTAHRLTRLSVGPSEHEKDIAGHPTIPGKVIRLGKLPHRHDPRTLKLSKYIKSLPPAPAAQGFMDLIGPDWGMMLNDSLGCCTVADSGHVVLQQTSYANPPGIVVTPRDILKMYMAVSGYNPNDPSSDNGAVILDVLKYWRKTGIAGHKILAFVAVNPHDHEEIKQAIALFGHVRFGLQLPVSAQDPEEFPNGDGNLPLWSVPGSGLNGAGQPGSWGGHDVPAMGYGTNRKNGGFGYEVISWGQRYAMTPNFVDAYADEAWTAISLDWVNRNSGKAPSGFDLKTLEADLAKL